MYIHVSLLLCVLVGTLAFLPTKLNFNDPELEEIFCPDLMTSPSINLKAITREGIRREIINLFNDEPPSNAGPDFNVPETATLSEMFHLYYGENSSPTRFYSAVNSIAWANADMDSMESTKYDARYHFDGEQITEGQDLLSERHNIIVASLLYNQSYDFARQQIGYSLHGIQDFYSHTSWYELGNTGILEGLGFSGFSIPNVANEDDVVCTACPDSDGSCTNNVVNSGVLTSGYYEYDVQGSESFIVDKPAAGKCSHGGSLDTSRTRNPQGGINKATTSPCFSPHFYNHEAVAELATQATQYYLSQIRFAIGNDRFRFLFELYQGSALVIVIDTTGSMSNEIDVVQEQVAIIVDTAPADLYILVPFRDPEFGPVTRTTDSDEFLDAVNALSAGGGGGFLEEMVWSALQLALLETPTFSTLYLFTDAGGVDYELMDGDIALAQEKSIICTTIYSYANGDFTGPPYTDDTDYMNLATVTGGEFIVIDDFTISNVVSIIGDGTGASMVSLSIRRDITGALEFIPALVDNTISSLQVVVSGDVSAAFVLSPGGTNYNLMDESSLDGVATVTAYTDSIKDISFANPEVGTWYIETDSDRLVTYSVLVNGQSTLGYLMEFTEIDSRPPRPNYRLINGQPIAGLSYYAETTLVGWIENEVDVVTNMVFLDDKGNVLSDVTNTEPVDDEFYIETEILPETRFYVGVNGQLNNGNGFTRLYETLITPAKVAVGVDLSSSNLAGTPGSTLVAVFNVQNNGPDATYDYFATDDKGYVTDFSPKVSFVTGGGTEAVEITLTIPVDAVPWTQSTIIVTASSQLLDYDINSDTAYVIVLPLEVDTTAPLCMPQNEPDCTGYLSSVTCDGGTWTVTAIIVDDDSELSTVYTQPSGDGITLEIDDYNESENFDAVNVTLTASCCITQLDIIGVDAQGNIGTCSYDMGELDGVLTFEVIDEGTTWILLEWTVTTVRPELVRYRLVTDDFLTNDVGCFETTCTYNATFLQPCSLHTFSLTPFFNEFGNGTLFPGSTALTSGSTTDVVPQPPTNGAVILSGDDATITWDAPSNDQCIVLYEVCYTAADTTTCQTSTTTSMIVTEYQYCTGYSVAINSQTASGLTSDPPLTIVTNAVEGIPGEPTNLHMMEITPYQAFFTWDKPATNASCANDYTVNWKIVDSILQEFSSREEEGEFWARVHPLVPCENYQFTVWANSLSGMQGPPAIIFDTAGEVDPPQPVDVEVTSAGFFSLFVTWTSGGAECFDHYLICWTNQRTNEFICDSTEDTSYTITGLDSCTNYLVTVYSLSPAGIASLPSFGSASTEDEVPGAPSNLTVIETTSTSIQIGYDLPVINPQCVAEFSITTTDLNSSISDISVDNKALTIHSRKVLGFDFVNTLDGLTSCTYFMVSVVAVSPRGLRGPEAITTTTTLEALPSAPVDLTAQSLTPTTIDLHWNEPDVNSRCADWYEIIWVSQAGVPGRDELHRTNGQFDFSYTIENLDPCMQYTIGVTPETDSIGAGTLANTIVSTLCI